ncbi:MAG: DUF1178 family protein [Candidatus Accumulibacter sp.]|jgi:hypothetical protein|nr:DUF1178 family protein [Accumulibacter sp.]
MIIFDLSCNTAHRFEGYFQSTDAFDAQLAKGLISCPSCGSLEIRRVPSAVHLTHPARPPRAAPSPASVVMADSGGELLNTYRKLMAAIMANSEDVGTKFASEARKIHYLEAPERSIHGQASEKEFKSLREEGIEVLRLPVIKKENLN